jgi:hypothetical protein
MKTNEEIQALAKLITHYGPELIPDKGECARGVIGRDAAFKASYIPFFYWDENGDGDVMEKLKPIFDDKKCSLFLYPPHGDITWATWILFNEEKNMIEKKGITIEFVIEYNDNIEVCYNPGPEEVTEAATKELREILGIDQNVKSEYIEKQIRIHNLNSFNSMYSYYSEEMYHII